MAESAGAVGVLSGEPSAPGHCVFFPRRHTPNLHDLDDAELAEIFSLVKRVAIALEIDQYNVLQNNGARAGQTRRCFTRTSISCRSQRRQRG